MVETQQQGRATSRFPLCQGEVFWVLTVGDRRWRLDVEPDPDGTVVLLTLPDGKVRGRVLAGTELPAQEPAYTDHDRTCPEQKHTALQNRRAWAAKPKCRARCGTPLAQWLIERGEDIHPMCDYELELRAEAAAATKQRAQELREARAKERRST